MCHQWLSLLRIMESFYVRIGDRCRQWNNLGVLSGLFSCNDKGEMSTSFTPGVVNVLNDLRNFDKNLVFYLVLGREDDVGVQERAVVGWTPSTLGNGNRLVWMLWTRDPSRKRRVTPRVTSLLTVVYRKIPRVFVRLFTERSSSPTFV